MKNYFYLLCFLVLPVAGGAQTYSDYVKIMTGQATLAAVSALPVPYAFDQANLSVAAIDRQIADIVQQQHGRTLQQTDLPVNSKKLVYWGRMNPRQKMVLDTTGFRLNMPMIDREMEIYNYDGVYILVRTSGAEDLLNVYFAARAIELIRHKYPEAYERLIKPDQVQLGYYRLQPYPEQLSQLPVINRLSPVIAFDGSPRFIAGSLWNKYLSAAPTFDYLGYMVYLNTLTALTSYDYSKGRPKEIYQQADSLMNFYLYLREGLVESVIHEFTHHYITNFALLDARCAYIFNKRADAADPLFDDDAEEAIVLNTVHRYFTAKGGLSDTLGRFYERKLQVKKAILTAASPLQQNREQALRALTQGGAATWEDIYVLPVFEP